MTRCVCLAVVLLSGLPGVSAGQPPSPPRLEAGAQVSSKVNENDLVTWTPRLTLNLSPWSALEGTADILKPSTSPFGTRTTGQAYSLHWRQTLFVSKRWQVFGVLGAGTERRTFEVPEQIFEGRDGPVVIPPSTIVDSGLAAHLGPAVQFEAAPWLALRGDVRLTVSDDGGVRGMIGAVVPVGRFRAGDRPGGATPPLAIWQRVGPGREVWVTTSSGALVHGEVASISDRGLALRRTTGDVTIPLDDIDLVEGRDSLKQGILIGGAAGAAGGATLFVWAASVFCETDPCDPVAAVALVFGAAAGAAVGGLVGAMVDSLIPGRQTLFTRNAIRVVPVATREQKSLAVHLSWR